MSVIADLVSLVAKLPDGGISALVSIVRAALASDDPDRYLRRLTQAKAAHTTTKAAAAELLEKAARKP